MSGDAVFTKRALSLVGELGKNGDNAATLNGHDIGRLLSAWLSLYRASGDGALFNPCVRIMVTVISDDADVIATEGHVPNPLVAERAAEAPAALNTEGADAAPPCGPPDVNTGHQGMGATLAPTPQARSGRADGLLSRVLNEPPHIWREGSDR